MPRVDLTFFKGSRALLHGATWIVQLPLGYVDKTSWMRTNRDLHALQTEIDS